MAFRLTRETGNYTIINKKRIAFDGVPTISFNLTSSPPPCNPNQSHLFKKETPAPVGLPSLDIIVTCVAVCLLAVPLTGEVATSLLSTLLRVANVLGACAPP
ncbi:hypothetical protein PIB30_005609 [Stylosanthes scabra]|uniref:Uncharacterized protein n=1 Tax=Stylosanthes scabra TaxID=79078 RepID=A0ABU6S4J8_9FABA|nr:hypothetical protein [Stylosanthes scabra]